MKTIWKYTLNVTGSQSIQMPILAEMLTIQLQNKELQLWVLVDQSGNPDKLEEFVTIHIYGTGHPIDKEYLEYINTFQEGDLVFHVFKEL